MYKRNEARTSSSFVRTDVDNYGYDAIYKQCYAIKRLLYLCIERDLSSIEFYRAALSFRTKCCPQDMIEKSSAINFD